jgi:hypothetical protein
MFQATALLLQERIPKASALYWHAAEHSDIRMTPSGSETPVRVFSSPDTPIPEVQLLSNGRYHVMVTNAGGGYSRWKDMAVTRWREDGTCDNWGTFCYLRDISTGEFWSTAYQPTLKRPESYEAIFSEAKAEFRSRSHEIDTHTEIAVSPEDDIELRRITLTNRARTRRTIDVTSYAEVVLASPAEDALHPAFSNLFVQTEIIRPQRAILCTRRPRSREEHPLWMFHLMGVHGADIGEISYETDRSRFIGRGNTVADPQAMTGPSTLSGTEGSVLDPIVAIRYRIALEPEESATINILSGIGATRDACLSLVEKYQDRRFADRVFELAWTHNQLFSRQINAIEADAQLYGRLAGSVLYANSRTACRSKRSHPKPSRAIRSMELRNFRRFSDRAAADPRPRQYRFGAPSRAGPHILALKRADRGPGDLERRSLRVPTRVARTNHGADCRRHRSQRDRSTGRHLCQTCGPDPEGGPYSSPNGRSRNHHRQPRDPGGADQPSRPRGRARPAPCADPHPPTRIPCDRRIASPRSALFQRPGRIHHGWARVCHHDAQGNVTPAPWVNVSANPNFGTLISESGPGMHLERKCPRVPPHPLDERPRKRFEWGSLLHSRRREGPFLVPHAAAEPRSDALRLPARIRLQCFRAHGTRHPLGDVGLRSHGRADQVHGVESAK